MKKTKFLFGALALLAIVICNSSADAVSIVSLQPTTTTPAVGSSFNVLVNISSVTDLFGYQFDVQYNPSVLSAASVTEGPFVATGGTTFFIPGAIDNGTGLVSFTSDALIGALSGVNGSGTLVILKFSAIAKGTSSLGLSNVELLDSIFNDIAFTTSGATVTPISTGNPVPEPGTGILVRYKPVA